MMNSLDALIITFMVMSVLTVIGLVMVYLVKNETMKKGLVYIFSVWGMIIAWCNVMSTPEYMTGSILLAWALGFLGVAALIVQLCAKHEKKFRIARILATVSVVAGMIDCFMI